MSCVSWFKLLSECPVCVYKLLIPSIYSIATDKMSSFSLSERNFSGLFSAVTGGSFFCFQPLMGTLQTPAAELTIQDFDLSILYIDFILWNLLVPYRVLYTSYHP